MQIALNNHTSHYLQPLYSMFTQQLFQRRVALNLATDDWDLTIKVFIYVNIPLIDNRGLRALGLVSPDCTASSSPEIG